jgi:hypothetical protein
VRLALASVVAASLLAAGCGGAGSRPNVSAVSPSVAERLMKQRLRGRQLDYTWLACIVLERTYEQVHITRCNVGFGIDPHVEAYCVVLESGVLVTNHERPAIPCRHDDAGWDGTTITSS